MLFDLHNMEKIYKLSRFVILFQMPLYAMTSVNSTQLSSLFKIKCNEYIEIAKQVSQRNMTKDEINLLADKAISIIDDLKNHYITEKLHVGEIYLKYRNGEDFPDLSKHQNNTEHEQNIVKFTIACNAMFKLLTKEVITQIIEKSPLEMVSIIKELSVFLQFISANPSEFGHGVLSEKQGNVEIIYATNEAILRIMKVLIYKNLLRDTKIYKMSRIGTYLANNVGLSITKEIINTLKRNTSDDTRITITIPEAMLDLSFDESNDNEFLITSRNYVNEINFAFQSKDSSDRQVHMNKAIECAKILLGVINNTHVNTKNKVQEFCNFLEQKRAELSNDLQSADKKVALKANRDISNYIGIAKFMQCCSSLLDTLYIDNNLIFLIVEKIPYYVPQIGKELTAFIKALTIIYSKDYNFDDLVSKFRNFAKQSDDGSYLMSPLLSLAMDKIQSLDYTAILNSQEILSLNACKYLRIR